MKYKKLFYKIKFIRYNKDNTQYPAEYLKNALQRLTEFHKAYSEKPKPPLRLREWIKATLDNVYVENYKDNSKIAQRD